MKLAPKYLSSCLLGSALLWASAASAEPAATISVAPLKGASGAACARKLSALLTEEQQLPWPADALSWFSIEGFDELSSWAKETGAQSEAQLVVIGNVRPGKLILEAYRTDTGVLRGLTKIRTRSRCQISAKVKKAFKKWTINISAPEPPKAKPPAAVAQLTPPKSVPFDPPPTKKAAPKKKAPPKKVTTQPQESLLLVKKIETKASKPQPFPGPKLSQVSVELSMGLGQRNLSYTGANSSQLRGLQSGGMALPGFIAEIRPFAGAADLWAPLALKAQYQQALGMRAQRIEGGPEHEALYSEASTRINYAWQSPEPSLQIVPELGLHYLSFRLASAEGQVESEVPSVNYLSVWISLGLRLQITEKLSLAAQAALLPTFDIAGLSGVDFFGQGVEGRGISAQGRLAYQVLDSWQIYLSGRYLGYDFDLSLAQGGSYQALSAQDSFTQGSIGVAYQVF